MLEDLLRREVQGLHALEWGMFVAFDRLDGAGRHRRVASTLSRLTDDAARNTEDLAGILAERKWPVDDCPSLLARAWSDEAEAELLGSPPCPEHDAILLCFLRRAVCLKASAYETARLFALGAAMPAVAWPLAQNLERERRTDRELAGLIERGAIGGLAAFVAL